MSGRQTDAVTADTDSLLQQLQQAIAKSKALHQQCVEQAQSQQAILESIVQQTAIKEKKRSQEIKELKEKLAHIAREISCPTLPLPVHRDEAAQPLPGPPPAASPVSQSLARMQALRYNDYLREAARVTREVAIVAIKIGWEVRHTLSKNLPGPAQAGPVPLPAQPPVSPYVALEQRLSLVDQWVGDICLSIAVLAALQLPGECRVTSLHLTGTAQKYERFAKHKSNAVQKVVQSADELRCEVQFIREFLKDLAGLSRPLEEENLLVERSLINIDNRAQAIHLAMQNLEKYKPCGPPSSLRSHRLQQASTSRQEEEARNPALGAAQETGRSSSRMQAHPYPLAQRNQRRHVKR